jgi:hypothetical protein
MEARPAEINVKKLDQRWGGRLKGGKSWFAEGEDSQNGVLTGSER